MLMHDHIRELVLQSIRSVSGAIPDGAVPVELQSLLEKIYRERGFDFREYKETTLTRRLGRRMRARGVETYADYALVLDQDTGEYDKLFNDLTINVTTFFRDQAVFKSLEEVVLPALIQGHNKAACRHRCLRVWSAGCATGQEPYSIAMLLLEMLGPETNWRDVAILATDIDTEALQRAQKEVFTAKDVEDVRPALLNRYFVHEGGGFLVQSAVRQLVTFEVHNLVSDPPYQNLGLVVCRNVLIYFTPALQIRVLEGFHEALKEGGFLLLGKAEVPVGKTSMLFRCIDKKAKLYRSIGLRA